MYGLFGSDLLVNRRECLPYRVNVFISSLWLLSPLQTCGAFFGGWSGKKAKVFPGKRAGLSGDETRRALLPIPFGTLLTHLSPVWSWGDRVSEIQWPTPSWERADSPRGLPAQSRFGLCGFASNKEICCNPPNLLSISPLPAPCPARPTRREAQKVRAASSPLRRRLGSTPVRVCLCMCLRV